MNTPQDIVLVKYIRKESSSAENTQVEEWLKSDSENQKYLKNLSQLWLSREKKYENYSPSIGEGWEAVQARLETNPVIRLSKWKTLYKVAAVIAIISALTFLLLNKETRQAQLHTIVAQGSNEQHVLADGSIVTLNSGSSLSYTSDFGLEKRETILTGEAFFEVSRDESKPFTIQTGTTQTTVLGTSFNILEESDKIEVSVVSGKVSFGQTSTGKKVVLNKGEVGVQKGTKLKKELISDPNFLAWKTRKLIFNNQPLAIIINDLSKVYSATFTVENTTDQKITAEFDNQSLEEVLEVIASTLDVTIAATATNQYLIK